MYTFEIQVMVVVVIMWNGKAKKRNFLNILFGGEKQPDAFRIWCMCWGGGGVLFQEAKNKLKKSFLVFVK